MIGRSLFNWFHRRKRDLGPKFLSTHFVESMSDVPDDTGTSIYIVGSRGSAKWAVFDCPCGKGHQLRIPLMRSANPRWRLSKRGHEISLFPSVAVDNSPCSSHFWLQDNQVEWARWDWEE